MVKSSIRRLKVPTQKSKIGPFRWPIKSKRAERLDRNDQTTYSVAPAGLNLSQSIAVIICDTYLFEDSHTQGVQARTQAANGRLIGAA